MKITKKTFSALTKPYKRANERSYLLKFLTPVTVVINYHTSTSVIVVFCCTKCDFLSLFGAFINITKDDGGSLFITMPFIHQMATLLFA